MLPAIIIGAKVVKFFEIKNGVVICDLLSLRRHC
jgi:hypothetical protein